MFATSPFLTRNTNRVNTTTIMNSTTNPVLDKKIVSNSIDATTSSTSNIDNFQPITVKVTQVDLQKDKTTVLIKQEEDFS